VLLGYLVDKDLSVVDHVDNSITVYVKDKNTKEENRMKIIFRISKVMLLIVGKVFDYNVYMLQMMVLY
jgi:hypothetical protein